MNFEDEKIIAQRKAEQKKQYNSIETGIYVGDELVRFAESRMFEEQMAVMLPDQFADLPKESARKKYPSENRPQVIKSSQDGTINFTFSLLDYRLTPELLKGTIIQIQLLIQRLYPANMLLEDGELTAEYAKAAWFDFRSSGLDSAIYNFIYVIPVAERMMLGMFNAPASQRREWSPVVKKVVETIVDLTWGVENNEGC